MRLTADNYFSPEAERRFMSVSQFKRFERCEAEAMAYLKGEEPPAAPTEAMLVGSYVDAYFEGTLAAFQSAHPMLYTAGGTLRAPYQKAEEIIERIRRDKLFTEFMSGEKQVILTGEIAGVPIKIKVDSLHEDKIVDLKVMKDFKPIYKSGAGRLNFAEAWGYDLQGAVYREIVRQNTGKALPFYIAAATKETETDIGIFHISDALLDFELARFSERVPYYQALKNGVFEAERCGRCDWCKRTKILTKVQELEELNDEYDLC